MLIPGPTLGHGRVRTTRGYVFHAAAFLLAFVLFGVAQGSLAAPLVGWVTMDRTDPHFVHDMAFSALVLVAFVGSLTQLSRPVERVAVTQLTVVAVAGLATLVFLTSGTPTVGVLAALAALLVLAHPAGARVRRPRLRPVDRRAVVLVALATVPLLGYAAVGLRNQLTLAGDHAALGHWGAMALVALVALVAGVLGAGSTPGWRLAAWAAGFLVATVGLASLVSASASSVGPFWGVAALAWAGAFVHGVESRRRPTAEDTRTPADPVATESGR